ncbi:MAG: WXG100 family type VII secretion target [Egibacteraceae bacterium]
MGVHAGDDVRFNFGLALDVARTCHGLARYLTDKQAAREGVARTAQLDWTGPHADTFEQRMGASRAGAERLSAALRTLAEGFASSWAKARGEQDRVNFARYVERERANRNLIEEFGDFLFGEPDFGDPPSDPPVPAAPDFAPTRAPLYE